jgi:pyruvate dehydrogenase E1 component alpha subunit
MTAIGAPRIDDPSAARLLAFYREMLRIRLVEEEIARRYPEEKMRCPVHLSIGQEAVPVGISAALRRDDQVVSTHRCHAHYLAKGGGLKAMLAEIYGKAAGCCGGRGGSMHLFDTDAGVLLSLPIVASSIPVGVGAAFGLRQAGSDALAVVYIGDASVEEGVFHESANFAALQKLPVIFVLENNLYSVYTHLRDRQPDRPLHAMASAHAIPFEHLDGNDVTAVHGAGERAVRRARAGEGPSLLVCDTYRWREHCGPNYDNNIGYRTEEEFQGWRVQCPVERVRRALVERGRLDIAAEQAMQAEIMAEIEAAFAFADAAPFPPSSSAHEGVYA